MNEKRKGLDLFTKIVLWLGAVSLLVPGAWAYVATESFAKVAAPWATFGEHFLRDAGAFQVGAGVMVLAVVFWRDAITVILAGLATATLLHAISHGIDKDFGTAISLGVLGLLAAVAFVLRLRR